MIDIQTIAEEYARSYADKSRIYFIEKYLSTFNANVGKTIPIISKTESILTESC